MSPLKTQFFKTFSMKALDLSSTRLALRRMLDNGLITLENLDEPSPGFTKNMRVDLRTFPKGYRGVRFVNLLREDASQQISPEDF